MNSPRYPVPSLQLVFRGSAAIMAVLFLLNAIGLIYYPKEMRRETDQIQNLTQILLTTHMISANLLKFDKTHLKPNAQRTSEDLEEMATAQALAKNGFKTLRTTPAAIHLQPQVDRIEGYTNQFFYSGGLPSERSLKSALAETEQLRKTTEDQIEKLGDQTRYLDHLTDVYGRVLIGLFVIALGALFLVNRTLLYRPLIRLKQTLSRFRLGNEVELATPRGAKELRELAEIYNQMAKDLAKYEQNRFEFLAGVVHDLRNPLAALKMATDVLEQNGLPPTDTNARDTLRLADRQVERLNRMVNDLLEGTRIQAGQLKLETATYDLQKVIWDCVNLMRPTTTKHQIVVIVSKEPMIVRCDVTRIEQVLNNLLSNAIKYSPVGGRIVVKGTKTHSGQVSVSVTDQGIGISPSDMRQIFRPFHRAASVEQEKIPGAGLGLSVSKKIIEAHEGSITVESTPGLGSTFRFRLPCSGSAKTAA